MTTRSAGPTTTVESTSRQPLSAPVAAPAARMAPAPRATSATTIVAWDASGPARAALAWALRRNPNGALHLVHVLDRSQADAEYFVADSTATRAELSFREEADRIRRENPTVTITSEFLIGDPITHLRHLSGPNTLVVVGTHTREGSPVRYEWSVGARLAGAANGPIAIIPEDTSPRATGVVVGVDGSAASAAALAFAAAEADCTGMKLRAIHAWQEPLVWRDTATPDPAFLHSLEQVHQQTLQNSVRTATGAYPQLAVTSTLVRGAPQWALLDAARGAALVVVGNHGLYGIRRMLLGLVSHSIVLNIQSPTVIVNARSDADPGQRN
ncbi:universal stress protein [Cryobacterium frigoriphilum]|uniref:Universal stress protein n=2 Tax=Cryobacterium frigoriphilum TaxID=1259150 RepID=A0A4R9A9X4_9MICO|nr:universal stress protein [Cryobacterium frigoriphilum]